VVDNPRALVNGGGDGLRFAEFPSDAPKRFDVATRRRFEYQ
jgi:hypothetical protein